MIAQSNVNSAPMRQASASAAHSGSTAPGESEVARDGPMFADLFAATQAMFGARITALVDSIVPDGRGLKPPAADAGKRRLAQLSDDARMARQQRHKDLKDETCREPCRTRVNKSDPRRQTGAPPADQRGRPSPMAQTHADASRRAAPEPRGNNSTSSPATSCRGDRLVESPTPPRAGTQDGQRATALPPRPAGATGTRVADAQSTAPPVVSGSTAVSASGQSDGGALARRIGEILGVRAAPETARSTAAAQSAPAADGQAGRRGQAGSHTRGTGQSDRAPGQRAQAKEMPAPRQASFDRLIRFIRMNVGQRESSARLQLTPPELGRVRIDVRLVEQRMQLLIQAETRDARDLLGSRLDGLRGALANHGVTIERIELPDPSADGARQAPVGNHEDSRRRNPQDVGYASDDPGGRVSADDLGNDEQADMPEWVDAVSLGAASETRLDIRV